MQLPGSKTQIAERTETKLVRCAKSPAFFAFSHVSSALRFFTRFKRRTMRSHTFTTTSSSFHFDQINPNSYLTYRESTTTTRDLPLLDHSSDKAHFPVIQLSILSALALSKSIIGHFEKESIESIAQ